MGAIAIRAENLSKVYKLYNKPVDRVKEALNPFGKYYREFYALNNVSFHLERGQTLGVIGKNGSGKSTLLKILTGVLTPSGGTLEVNGRISSLLELGSGFNPELTGLENIYFYGAINGLSRQQMDGKVEQIISFAEIGQFIHQPVKTYSSGMFVRLAFAAAINIDPDILIVDEALSVGDMRFQKKCLEKIDEFREAGKTILFCSHDMHAIGELCGRVVWLKDGQVAEIGEPGPVISSYVSMMTEIDSDNTTSVKVHSNRDPNYYVRNSEIVDIVNVRTLDEHGNPKNVFFDTDYLKIEAEFDVKESLTMPHFNLAIFRKDKILTCLASTTFDKELNRKSFETGRYSVTAVFPKIRLNRGEYTIGFSVWDKAKKIAFANNITQQFSVRTLKVVFGPTSEGTVFFNDIEWRI